MSAPCEDCGRERYSLKRVREILGGDGLRLDLMATANNLCGAADKGNDTAVALCLTTALARERAALAKAEAEVARLRNELNAAFAATFDAQTRAETMAALVRRRINAMIFGQPREDAAVWMKDARAALETK